MKNNQRLQTNEKIETRRFLEIILLALVDIIFAISLCLVDYKITGQIGKKILVFIVIFTLTGLFYHIILQKFLKFADQIILPVVMLLASIGVTIIYRIELPRTRAGFIGYGNIATMQFAWIILSLVLSAGMIFFIKDYIKLRRYIYTSMAIGLVLLISPILPIIGTSVNGAQLWINLAGITIQPAEFAKIFLSIFFAGYLVEKRDVLALAGPKILGIRFPRLQDFGPILFVWAGSLGILVLQHDLGTSLLFFGMFLCMLYVATDRPSWLVIGGVLFLAAVSVILTIFPYVAARFDIWLNPFAQTVYERSPGGSGQIVQGLFGLAAGGLFGTGWGSGHPGITPFADSDFVFTSIGEQIGLTGIIVILLCYLILSARGIIIAKRELLGFGKLLSSGIAFSIILQVFVVVGGITLIIPLTGLTLPLLSRGGSSLMANFIFITILLVVSNSANTPKEGNFLQSDELLNGGAV
ncbi:MAG: FtsW/RodA/SpoVE family cell cycle protein [Bifidobacteriaceae bacterium]|jgi:cell division protein FtsW (lipid II flippase)|nr:FtsW/RodA/SpoVE family cell cycle protein [Bifidobacteriaceae bacterium]